MREQPVLLKCSKCGAIKEAKCFHKMKTRPRGYSYQCKACCPKYQKEYRNSNKDVITQKIKEYRIANKDAIAQSGKEYYMANKAAIAQKKKEYRIANKDAIAQAQKKYSQTLTEGYVISLLCQQGLAGKQITPELLQLKREQIILQRELREVSSWV